MKGASYITKILSIRLRLHYTWYLAFILITAIVVNQFPVLYQLWERTLLGLVTSLIFLFAIGIRQLALRFVAIHRRVPLKNFTLFVFGGVPDLAKEDNLPIFELLMGASGILFSLILAIVFYLIHMALVITGSIVAAGIIQWLAFITLMLTVFHFIPAYPLDGGKLLMALFWKKSGDYYRAVRITGWIGWVTGLLLTIGGILLLILAQEKFTGLTLAFVGFTLERAATQCRRQETLRRNIQDIPTGDIMSREYPVITRQLSIGQLVRQHILVSGQHYFIIADGAELQGIVTVKDIKSIPKKKWNSTQVGEAMTPVSAIRTARINQPAESILEQMDKLGINQMPVLEEDKVVGIVTREDLIRLSKTRAQLGK